MHTPTIPQKPDERRAWIKYQLELRGETLGGLARKLGLFRTCVAAALHKPYPKMERVIADVIGCRPEQLWPERYSGKHRNRRRKGGQ
jgi:Ner family transcriptional regulator